MSIRLSKETLEAIARMAVKDDPPGSLRGPLLELQADLIDVLCKVSEILQSIDRGKSDAR